MTFEEAIRAVYGIKVPLTASDFKMRKFRIDELRNGFLMKTGKCGVFGSFIDGETYIWTTDRITQHEQEHKDSKEIRFEWLVWEAARATFERGERLNATDRERLALAVKRLEEWL